MNNATSFINNPTDLKISRSKYDLSFRHSTTFSAGELVPIMNYEMVLPGDTFKVNVRSIIRSTTPVAPVMDDAFLDIYFFAVPHKSVLNRESMSSLIGANAAAHSFNQWIGAQDSLLNMPFPTETHLPLAHMWNDDNFKYGGLADHFTLQEALADSYYVTPWSFLAYANVWNHYFRDPNTMNPITLTVNSDSGSPTGYSIQLNNYNGSIYQSFMEAPLLYACRRHGYFGSSLPFPQRSPNPVTLPLGDSASLFVQNNTAAPITNPHYYVLRAGTDGSAWSVGETRTVKANNDSAGFVNGLDVKVDLSTATASAISAIRYAFQLQKYYERLARSGNTLQSLTKTMFGVTPHDFLDDVPEFLGGKSILLQNHLVANTAGTTIGTDKQMSIGSTGAYSLTGDDSYYFTKSFDTWSTLLAVCVVRPRESFAQGIDRQFKKFDPMQTFNPLFLNMSEQGTLKEEIKYSGDYHDKEFFGFMPAWTEYRMIHDKVTGELRPGRTMQYWTYVNNFESAPTLSSYLAGNTLYKNIDQTLQVSKDTAGFQYMAQFEFDITAVRPIGANSAPGFIDHH